MIVRGGDVVDRLEAQYGSLVWETAEGDLVPLRLMTEKHLRNCHAYLLSNIPPSKRPQSLWGRIKWWVAQILDGWGIKRLDAPEPFGATKKHYYVRYGTTIHEQLTVLRAEAKRRGIQL